MTLKIPNPWAVLAAVAILSGCAAPSKPANHYLMLPAAPAATAAPEDLALEDLALGVGPVTLTDYLQRQNLVVRESPTRVRIAPDDRWAAPLDAHLSELLATNLRRHLGIEKVSTFPWPRAAQVDYQVTVHVARFIHYGDRVRLEAHWRIFDARPSLVAEHLAEIEEPSGAGYDSIVEAMSRAVGGLSDEIAGRILRGNAEGAWKTLEH